MLWCARAWTALSAVPLRRSRRPDLRRASQLFITQTLPAGSMARSVCRQASTHVPAGRRHLIACLHAGRTGLGAHSAQMCDPTRRTGEVGDPDVVVAIHGNGPGAGKTATRERRAGIFGAIRPQQRNAASVGAPFLVVHGRARKISKVPPLWMTGPPVAPQTISVRRYLKPAGGTR
jgi:hypothetical protein